MEIKGLRDIATHNSAINRVMPRTRAGAAFELALLEHQKSNIERELGIWAANQKRAEMRLQSVRERSVILRKILEDAAGEQQKGIRRKSRRSRPKPAWRPVTLEY